MADTKEFETVATTPPTYNEKTEDSTAKHNEFPEDTGRRQSVALNIVENPLKVCINLSSRRGQSRDHVLTFRSISRTSKLSPMPENGLKLTACKSMPLSSPRLPWSRETQTGSNA